MILTDFDIARRKEQRIKEMNDSIGRGAIPPTIMVIGHPTQYFFAHDTEDGEGGICGLNAVILGVRDSIELGEETFFADLAILSEVPGFYVEYLNIEVITISLTDENGNKTNAICRATDIETVEQIMNSKFRVDGKPDLKLIVDNNNKKE